MVRRQEPQGFKIKDKSRLWIALEQMLIALFAERQRPRLGGEAAVHQRRQQGRCQNDQCDQDDRGVCQYGYVNRVRQIRGRAGGHVAH